MEKTNDKQWTRVIAFIVLVMWMGLSSALAQSITVKGQVLDAKSKEPLIGVSVLEKGTTNGTITDFDGNYVLNVAKGRILVFSYVGYTTQENRSQPTFFNRFAERRYANPERGCSCRIWCSEKEFCYWFYLTGKS